MDQEKLVKKLKDKTTRDKGFKELIRLYQEPLYHHIRRMVGSHDDADDALQNTFIKAWRFIDDFKEESKLFTWLYRIATNEALGFLRSQKTRITEELDPQFHASPITTGPDENTILKKLDAALKTLPDKQRQVFDLKYFADLPYKEISEITGTSIGGLKASYYHAVKKIEEYLKSH